MCIRREGKDAKYTLLDYMKSEMLEKPGDPNITEITHVLSTDPGPAFWAYTIEATWICQRYDSEITVDNTKTKREIVQKILKARKCVSSPGFKNEHQPSCKAL